MQSLVFLWKYRKCINFSLGTCYVVYKDSLLVQNEHLLLVTPVFRNRLLYTPGSFLFGFLPNEIELSYRFISNLGYFLNLYLEIQCDWMLITFFVHSVSILVYCLLDVLNPRLKNMFKFGRFIFKSKVLYTFKKTNHNPIKWRHFILTNTCFVEYSCRIFLNVNTFLVLFSNSKADTWFQFHIGIDMCDFI